MSKIIMQTYKAFEDISFKKFLLGVLLVVLIFSVVTVKVKNIKLGYEINRLKKERLQKEIEIESIERKISKIKETANLLKKSDKFNLVFPEYNKVFYVE